MNITGKKNVFSVGTGSSATRTTTTTTVNPDGSKTETTTTTNQDCSGTECKDTGTKTTVKNIGADGKETGSSSACTGEGCDDGKSKIAGMGCEVPINCKGDAIQCAMAKQLKDQNCFFEFDAADIEGQLQGEEYSVLGSLAGDSDDISLNNIVKDTGAFSENRSCPPPIDFTVLGSSFTVEVQPLCDLAGLIRYLVLAAAWIAVAWMIGRGM